MSENIPTKELLLLLEKMIEQQQKKCLTIARRIVPHLTPDDVMNPFDWPEVATNPQFVWEDGLLAGLQSAQSAIMAEFRHLDIPQRE